MEPNRDNLPRLLRSRASKIDDSTTATWLTLAAEAIEEMTPELKRLKATHEQSLRYNRQTRESLRQQVKQLTELNDNLINQVEAHAQ